MACNCPFMHVTCLRCGYELFAPPEKHVCPPCQFCKCDGSDHEEYISADGGPTRIECKCGCTQYASFRQLEQIRNIESETPTTIEETWKSIDNFLDTTQDMANWDDYE